MAYEIKTPLLKTTASEALGVIAAIKAGNIEKDDALNTIRACEHVQRAVGRDLQVRLAAPKLADIESAGKVAA